MIIKNADQLKSKIKKVAEEKNIDPIVLLHGYMMEKLLERIAVSKYKDCFILKGGMLIATMVGQHLRSTMDMDTTLKKIKASEQSIRAIMDEIFLIDLKDDVSFKIIKIKNIHDISQYDDFRITIQGIFQTIKVGIKIDVTVGDLIIPREIDYKYPLMFEARTIDIKAYNLNTILAEKIESILARNISNTRARDYYDVYILMKQNSDKIKKGILMKAIHKKAIDRDSESFFINRERYINDIEESDYIQKNWRNYRIKYPYAKHIKFDEIMKSLKDLLC